MAKVNQVAVKKRGGFNLMNRKEFLALPSSEKKAILMAKNAEFIDEAGRSIPFMEGLKDILDK